MGKTPITPQESGDTRSRLIVIITLIAAVIVGVIFALSQLYRPRPAEAVQVKAVTASPPLIYLAGPILDNSLAKNNNISPIKSLITAGADLHNFTPSPSDIENALAAEVFFTLNSDLLPLDQLFMKNSSSDNHPNIISAEKNISLIHLDEEDEHEHEHSDHELDDVDYDIHIWMSPRQAIQIVENFEKGLSELYPDNSIYYRARGGEFKAHLRDLNDKFQDTLSNCKKDTILVSHNAFSYLARDYGFEVLAIYDFGMEVADMTPSHLIEATEKIRELNIDYLYYTQEASPRILETITDELGVTLLPLYTMETGLPQSLLETKEVAISDAYIMVMEENLQFLAQGLNCPLNN